MFLISPYPTFIQVKDYIDGIYHCDTVVGKWIYNSNFPFAFPLTKENLDYCCINYNETKGMNGYKGLLKENRFSTKYNNKIVIQKITFIKCV